MHFTQPHLLYAEIFMGKINIYWQSMAIYGSVMEVWEKNGFARCLKTFFLFTPLHPSFPSYGRL